MAKKTKPTPPDIELIQSEKFDIALVDNNTGQIPGVPENPREMSEMEYKKLLKSLQRDSSYTAISELKLYPYEGRWIAIGGNMRLQAMKELGWTTVIGKPIPADTDTETLTRWILLDNANFGKWDFDKLANQFDTDLLDDLCIEIPPAPEIEDEEEAKDDNCNPSDLAPAVPTSRLGDIYQLGVHRLVVGDSTKSLYLDALMQDDLADCLITDPPYNVNYEGSNGKKIANDKMSDGNFQEFLFDAFSVANEHLKQGGAFYIWHADSEGYNFRTAAKRVGWTIRQCIIWNKNSLVLGRQDYQWKHEPCLYGWKDGGAHYFVNNRSLTTVLEQPLDLDAMTKDEMKKLLASMLGGDVPTTVIDENKPLRNAEHPTMKPVPLIGKQIKNSSRWGEIILDIFGGSGTTLIAAEQLGRQCRMVEFDPVYADVIVKRWEELTGKQARRLGNCLDKAEKTNSETKPQ